MCGIVGILNDARRPADAELLSLMLDRLQHRGPDDVGCLVDGELAMGLRRLSIIDIMGGHQPIFNENGRYSIVFNGEIYNYRELRQDLQTRGHRFSTKSDTEVLVHLYEDLGERCVDPLRGMFAFAIWDRVDRSLFVARDRLGVKPLYYTITARGTLLFASEIKSLLLHPDVSAQMDVTALGDYLSLKYVPSPRTMFAGILSLPPGFCFTWRQGRLNLKRYWDISFDRQSPPLSDAEATEMLAELLKESVRLQLRSDVSFGAFLSGGVDSSTIVAIMSELCGETIKTFSVGFEGAEPGDELPYARDVAQKFRTEHHEIRIGVSEFTDLAEKVIWHLDQPIADQATAATWMVARLASQEVKMALTGEGGDELFAGYARYSGERLAPWVSWLPSRARRLVRRALPHLPGLRRAKIAAHALTQQDEADRFVQWFPLFNDDSREQLLSDDARQALSGWSPAATFRVELSRTDAIHRLDRMLYVDMKLWLADFLLLRGDKLTMANSLEARVPFLDHKLVEFAASLPPEMKLRGLTGKYILKKVAARWLPTEIIHRKKKGFPIPMSAWLRGPARPMIRDLLTPTSIRKRGWFRPEYVERLLSEHESGFASHGLLIWGLANIELWQRLFCDSHPSSLGSARQNTLVRGGQPVTTQ
jgi:asparagine synthase (glutamine-hydrolysing)